MSGNYYLSIGYLRGFVMLLVLGHHSVLSYQGYFGYVGHDDPELADNGRPAPHSRRRPRHLKSP